MFIIIVIWLGSASVCLLTVFICFFILFILFHSCCSLERVFGKTLLHEFPYPIANYINFD